MDRIPIIVSNRLPFVVSIDEKTGEAKRSNSAGGLVTALAPLVAKTQGYWIGWAGNELTEEMSIPESSDSTSITHDIKSSQIVPVFYTDEIYKSFYNGMCNASLWPLMHSLPILTVFKSHFWNAYMEVNTNYASTILELIKKLVAHNSEVRNIIEFLENLSILLFSGVYKVC